MRKGFTLLELLIVVIIIGILAAIAIPQFFKVAERARASEGVNALGALKSAQLRYYAEHSTLTTSLSDLDADILGLRYFHTPVVAAPTYDDQDNTNPIASIQRNATDNPGYGGYTLDIHGDGSISCTPDAASAKGVCPPGF